MTLWQKELRDWSCSWFHSVPTGSGVPRNFVRGGAVSANSVEDRENGDLGAVALQSGGSGGGCNLVQEISFHIVFFFFIQCPTCP